MNTKKPSFQKSDTDRPSFQKGSTDKPGFQKPLYQRKAKADVIFGIHPVREAVLADLEINKILIQKGIDKDLFQEIRELLTSKNYIIQYVPIEKINAIAPGNHQGIAAFVSPISYGSIETYADQWMEEGKNPFILVLDRLTDVRNFGAIGRTAECMGVDAILIPSKGSALVTADAVKASSGALNRVKVCKTESLKNSLFYLQQLGIRIIAVTEKTQVELDGINLRGPVALIMGSEEDGITSDLLNLADVRVKIPMAGEIGSMNVGVAAGIVLFEKSRQERNR